MRCHCPLGGSTGPSTSRNVSKNNVYPIEPNARTNAATWRITASRCNCLSKFWSLNAMNDFSVKATFPIKVFALTGLKLFHWQKNFGIRIKFCDLELGNTVVIRWRVDIISGLLLIISFSLTLVARWLHLVNRVFSLRTIISSLWVQGYGSSFAKQTNSIKIGKKSLPAKKANLKLFEIL